MTDLPAPSGAFSELTAQDACEALATVGLRLAPEQVRVERREDRWLVRLPDDRMAWFAASIRPGRSMASPIWMAHSPMLGATCVRSRTPASRAMRLGTGDASARSARARGRVDGRRAEGHASQVRTASSKALRWASGTWVDLSRRSTRRPDSGDTYSSDEGAVLIHAPGDLAIRGGGQPYRVVRVGITW
jgi:hypothetical protein